MVKKPEPALHQRLRNRFVSSFNWEIVTKRRHVSTRILLKASHTREAVATKANCVRSINSTRTIRQPQKDDMEIIHHPSPTLLLSPAPSHHHHPPTHPHHNAGGDSSQNAVGHTTHSFLQELTEGQEVPNMTRPKLRFVVTRIRQEESCVRYQRTRETVTLFCSRRRKMVKTGPSITQKQLERKW